MYNCLFLGGEIFYELSEMLTNRILLVHFGKALNNDSDEGDADNQFLQSEMEHSSVRVSGPTTPLVRSTVRC